MVAVILCGGLGTRLRGVVDDRPKVLAPVAGEPFLGYLLDHLQGQGISDIVLSTGHLGELVEDYVGSGDRWGVRVRCVREPEPLGTGGALRFVADALDVQEPFLVLNGDTFFSDALSQLVDFHAMRPEAQATLALVEVMQAARYGTVEADPKTGTVTAFLEKQPGRAGSAWINAGVYVLDPSLLSTIPPGRNVSLERDVFPRRIGRGLYACPFPDATFLDIGTPEDYARASQVLVRET
ncbi:MAG TPA: nucleotidyltransferase family protein [Rhodothermales bacterium]|nr:nucleotidyltransferase family protein [Rhodothermales bacterium]